MIMGRLLRVGLIALIGCLGVARADFDPAGTGWADLGDFVAAARLTGIDLRAPTEGHDFAQVPGGSGLALIGDAAVADPEAVRRFVQEGGRVIVAVESSAADPLLRALETAVREAPARGELLGGHPALMVLRPPDARVFAGVDSLVANRPIALQAISTLEPAVRFDDGAPFAFHLRIGSGELLLLGDASLFINLMLEAGDNRTFAANVLTWLSRAGEAPVTVIAGAAALNGTYGQPPLEAGLDGLNAAIAGLAGADAPTAFAVHLLLVLLLCVALAYALAIFPGRAARRPHLTRPAAPAGRFERAAGAPGGPAAPELPAPETPT